MDSLPARQSKPIVRKAEISSGYKMLEKANASGHAEDRDSRVVPRRKAADFQRVLNGKPK